MLWIRNVRLVDANHDQEGSLLIQDGRIAAVLGPQERVVGAKEMDGGGMTLMPGFVDLHAHFRDPGQTWKEDLESGSKAALAGGYTTVHLMGNTVPIVDDPSVYEDTMQRAKAMDLVDVKQVMAVTKGFDGKTLVDMSSIPSDVRFLSDDGKGIRDAYTMYCALVEAKRHGLGIMVHAEDSDFSSFDYRLAEDLITIRDVYLCGKTGARLHLSHVSTVDAVDAIRAGKSKGYCLTAETTPHHLVLWDRADRVNPPLRTEADAGALLKGLMDGTLDAIATDHAPHTEEEKEMGSPGFVGLETAFPVLYTALCVGQKISLKDLSRWMSKNPASILGLDAGELTVGSRADLVLIDLSKSYTICSKSFLSKSKNTPFEGRKVYGKVMACFHRGELKYKEESYDY